jgi:hypothetical protein
VESIPNPATINSKPVAGKLVASCGLAIVVGLEVCGNFLLNKLRSYVLYPSRRTAYLKKNWPRAWLEPVIKAASTIWEDEYKIQLPKVSLRDSESMPPPSKPSKPRGAILEA